MNIGAQLYTVRAFTQTPEDIAQTFAKVRAIGYRHVQCSAMGPIEPERLRDLLGENGLACVVTHTSPDRLLEETDAVVAEHKVFGCDSIGMGMMPERYRRSLEGLRAFIQDYTPAVRKIEDAGLTFHYHNHDMELMRFEGRTLLDMMLAEWPQIHLMPCTFWVQVGGGDPVDWIGRYGHRIRHAHLKDMAYGKTEDGFGRVFTPVLGGNMNYRGILAALEAVGTVQNVLVEQDDCYGADPFECLRASFENLSRLKAEGVFS